MKRQLFLVACGILMAILAFSPGSANANSLGIFDDTVSTCTGINCSSLRLPATVLSFGTGSAGSWIGSVFAQPGNCVRLDVISEFTDLEMVVVAPNGLVFRNDDRGGGDLRPLVKIGSAPVNGWYMVHIAHWTGAAVSGNFTLLYGRYNGGNVNCATPTPAIAPETLAPAKSDSGVRSPQPGAPGSE